jgi:hypothetical protein
MLLDAKRRRRVPPTRLLSSEIGQVIREAPPTGGSPGPTLPSPPTGLGIPDHLKLKFAATVLAEGYSDGSEDLDIVWIYYNLVVVKGMGETGLRRSSQFDSKYGTPPQAPVPKYLFKLYMAALGDRTYSNVPTEDKNPDVVKKYPTIGDFVHPLEGHPYFLRATPTIGPGVSRARVDKLMNFLATQDPSKNPYSGWFGQGSRVDFNRDDGKWRKARAYYRLQLQGFQLQGKPLPEYVKKLKATYIFHEDAIIKFFTDNPGLLPEQVQVPKEP